ncbi:MAG TPA: PHP domain-containing protein [Tepidisphaeraceae bacterium]|nr:PHP domain-containing protein [Tepidisphaeraceae bacterium]
MVRTMPETPNPKFAHATLIDPPEEVAAGAAAYAELDVATNFSFLRGASHPDELVYTAALLGYRAMAVTDRNTLAGVVRAHAAAKRVKGFRLIIGARLSLVDAPELLAWATDRAAYGKLCRLLTLGKRRAEKGQCELRLEDFLEHNEGLLAAVDPGAGRVAEKSELRQTILTLREVLRDRLSIVASCPYGEDDGARLAELAALGRATGVPLVATNHVHYHDPGRRMLQDVLTCVRHGCTVRDAGYRLFPNGERYLKSPGHMHRLFAEYPGAIRRGLQIAERCLFSLDELKYEYPDEVVPAGATPMQHLSDLTWAGAAERYPGGVPEKVARQVADELDLIGRMKIEHYFLTVYDVVRFARSRGILCQGRGSAANSAVCYCLGVTAVDPAVHDLLFARFVSTARNEPPDIDIDFEHERREEVIQYVYGKYGRDRSGMTATVITYRGRSAVRDVGKALGLSLDMVDSMAKRLDWWHRGTLTDDQLRDAGVDPTDPTVCRLIDLTGELLGFPRHLSQHTGGMVMTRGPLCEMVPIENASMPDRTVIEWDKDDIDEVGILKIDVLALGMLTALSKALGMLNRRHEGTKARRHEGGSKTTQSLERGTCNGGDSDASGSGGVAEGNGAVENDLCGHAPHAAGREVRPDEPDAPRGGVGAVEYRRGIRAGESQGLPEAPADFPRFSGGTFDAVGTDYRLGHARAQPRGGGTSGGNRSRPPRIDSGRTEIRPAPLALAPPDHPSCLRASVPPCLPRLELHTIPDNDPVVYDMICDGDTIGVFQIESRAQMAMLPRLRPRCFYDLVIEVAIVRPGPIQGDMVHPYLRRRRGEEPVTFPSEELRRVLGNTLGVPLFQEQAMKVVMVAADFSAADADRLRRAMAAWKKNGALEQFRDKVVGGMVRNGYPREFAEQTFNQIRGFGEYGFPESHAASFARLVYASAWIKRHYPAAFCAALLNSQPMGFYAPAQLVRDARDHGVEVRPADVNASEWDCTLEDRRDGAEVRRHEGTEARRHEGASGKSSWGWDGPAVRLGFRQIKGMREDHALRIVEARARWGWFGSVAQLHRRSCVPVATLRRLAEADAFGSMGLSRRQALWQVLKLKDDENPLFDENPSSTPSCLRASVPSCLPPEDEPTVTLPTMPLGQEVITDYTTAGLSLKHHPVALVRAELDRRKVITAAQLADQGAFPHGRWVRIAGVVLIRQRPGTASGVVFITLEDETGVSNLIVWPHVYERYHAASRHASLLEAEGYVQRDGQVVHVLAKRMFDQSWMLEGLGTRSRDFH